MLNIKELSFIRQLSIIRQNTIPSGFSGSERHLAGRGVRTAKKEPQRVAGQPGWSQQILRTTSRRDFTSCRRDVHLFAREHEVW